MNKGSQALKQSFTMYPVGVLPERTKFNEKEIRKSMIEKYLKLDKEYGQIRYNSEKAIGWDKKIDELNNQWDLLNESEKLSIKEFPSDILRTNYFNNKNEELSTISE